jgi:hypothetical protein
MKEEREREARERRQRRDGDALLHRPASSCRGDANDQTACVSPAADTGNSANCNHAMGAPTDVGAYALSASPLGLGRHLKTGQR